MAKKIVIFLINIIILISLISAQSQEFSIEIYSHYYKSGVEILPTKDIIPSAISFEIIGTNHNLKSRLLNLSIIDAYPLAIKNALPDLTSELRILQEKTIFISQIISTKKFTQQNISLFVGVSGINEKSGKEVYTEGYLNLTILNELQESKEENTQSILMSFGGKIWQDNPTAGLLFIVGVIFLFCFICWKYKFSDKANMWREKTERRRIEEKNQEEGFY